jgi:hypothetical protein
MEAQSVHKIGVRSADKARRAGRWGIYGVTLLLFLLAFVSSLVLVPRVAVSETTSETTAWELGNGRSPDAAAVTGSIDEDPFGYVVSARSSGEVMLRISPRARQEDDLLLRLWAYAPASVSLAASLRPEDGPRRFLGLAERRAWDGEEFSLFPVERDGQIALTVSVVNDSPRDVRFLDRVAITTVPNDARSDVPAWLFSGWVVLLAALVLRLLRRLRRHWPVLVILGSAAFLFWQRVFERADAPVPARPADLWRAVTSDGWFDLDAATLGTPEGSSLFTIQIFHALTAVLGVGTGAVYAANAVTGLFALAAIYALGNRVAGPVAGFVAAALPLAFEPFRDYATNGTTIMTAITAAALLGYAVHASLAEASMASGLLLAGAGALAVLAEPVWLPAVVAVVVLLPSVYGQGQERLRVAGLSLIAFIVFLIPSRVPVARAADGDVFADLSARAAAAEVGGAAAPNGMSWSIFGYVFDGGVGRFIGRVASGGYESVAAFAHGGGVLRIVAIVLFAVGLVGVAYILLVPRLRALPLTAALVAVVSFVFVARGDMEPFEGAAAFLPAFCASAGLLVYVLLVVIAPGRRAALNRLPAGSGASRVPASAFDRPDRQRG